MKIKALFILLFAIQFCASPPPKNPGEEYDNIARMCFDDPCFISTLQTAIAKAEISIDLALYGFTDERITGFLNDAVSRGVQIRAVSDYDSENQSGFQNLIHQNIPVVFGNSSGIMHNKYIIIDKKYLITGSANLTKSIAVNFNHMLLIRSKALCQIYSRDFENFFSRRFFSNQKSFPGAQNPIEFFPVSVGQYKIYPLFTPYSSAYELKTYPDPENPGETFNYQNIFTRILPYIEKAENSIRILAYSLTEPVFIASLKKSTSRNVELKALMDRNQYLAASAQTQAQIIDLGNTAQVMICRPPNEGLLHHKAIWIDRKIQMAGSFNFSKNAMESNDENFLIIENAANLTEIFDREMDRIMPYCKKIQDFQP